MQLNEHPFYPYPSDPLTRFGFLVGDLIAYSVILLIAYISLKATIQF